MMNKNLSIVFIVIFLGSFFFCTFLRIESWPFSDYRIFAKHSHPKLVEVYVPYFELSDGSYIPPIIQKKSVLHIDRSHFHIAYKKYSSLDYYRYINKLLQSKEMRWAIKEIRRQNLFPVKFIVMEVTFTEKQKHKWTPIYTPLKKYDIL